MRWCNKGETGPDVRNLRWRQFSEDVIRVAYLIPSPGLDPVEDPAEKPISQPETRHDIRREQIGRWLDTLGLPDGELRLASGDASFRRYFRRQAAETSYIAMDAPPEKEDCLPFVRVAAYLEAMGLNAPRIVAADVEQGFLLLTDLGDTLYLDRLGESPEDAGWLYADAIDALLVMQERGAAYAAKLPPYDVALLDFELSLFHDWLCGTHLDIEFDAGEEMAWRDLSSILIRNALDQPQVFVHRDYHSRNLMVVANDNPGILDFQDAMHGPLAYDVVSLLKDCYVRWPEDRIDGWLAQFCTGIEAMPGIDMDAAAFRRAFDLMGVQRHLKAAGIFARLNHRDGKPRYLADVPRTLGYVTALGERYDELEFVVELIEKRVLPAFEHAS